MKKILILFLMGISVMLSTARPIVDPLGPQFSGQEIQTFKNEVTNPICLMPEVSYNLIGDGIFLVCFVELVDEPVCKLEFPELDAKVEYFAFTDDFYRPLYPSFATRGKLFSICNAFNPG